MAKTKHGIRISGDTQNWLEVQWSFRICFLQLSPLQPILWASSSNNSAGPKLPTLNSPDSWRLISPPLFSLRPNTSLLCWTQANLLPYPTPNP